MKPSLSTERLKLRIITWDDLEAIHALHSMPEVDEFNTLGIPSDIDVTRAVLSPIIDGQNDAEIRLYSWVIIEKSSAMTMGMAGLSLSEKRFMSGEIYYKLAPDHWGKGYATEAAQAVIQYGFSELGLHRIEAGVATGNARSINVLEKLHMKREGIGRKTLPIRGRWHDHYYYAVLAEEWQL